MKSQFEGMRPGQPMIVDDQGRLISVTLRLIPESPEEVAELRRFCRITDSFNFIIDESYRQNSAHIAPVYAERTFSVVQRPSYLDELME